MSLTGENCAAATEYSKAKAYYEVIPPHKKAFPFAAYKAEDVKEALNALFHGKCAYCESRYESGQPMDVEHYRPKGGILENDSHRGYWWLAANWNNLLASCIDCNRRRSQVSATVGMTLAELAAARATTGDTEPGGKHDAFPTIDSTWADPETDPDTVENPALIDPTRTDPSRHLVWPQAEVSVVLPLVDAHGVECTRAAVSIHIYALNRIGLVQSRLEIRQKLDAHIQTIRETARVAMNLTGTAREDLIKILVDGIIDLRKQTGARSIFSAMAKARLASFEAELAAILATD